jgi:hypothetical protein
MVTTGIGPLPRSVRYELWVIVMLPDHLHDWYIDGIEVDGGDLRIRIHFEAEKRVLVFAGASRCIVNGFLIQNVIYDISIFSSEDDPSRYDEAIVRLNKSYPWPPAELKKIAEIRPSVGADITIEFSTVSVLG